MLEPVWLVRPYSRVCSHALIFQMETKIILARLLQTFKVTLPPSYKVVVEQLATQQPKGDVPCSLREIVD